MTDYTADIHMFVPRPLIETDPETYPSITIRNVPRSELGGGFTLSVTGDEGERRAVAADLRRAAAFLDAWKRPAEEPPVPADAHAAWCDLDDGHVGACRLIEELAFEGADR